MTLSTDIYLMGPVPLDLLHAEVNRLLKAPPGVRTHDEANKYGSAGLWSRGNDMGQGLPAAFDITYHPDGLIPDEEPEFYEGQSDEAKAQDREWAERYPKGRVLILNFDTTYGYKAENGASCSDLHAYLVRELGKWFEDRGVKWYWRNEFTGDIFEGYDGLDEFGHGIDGEPEPTLTLNPVGAWP